MNPVIMQKSKLSKTQREKLRRRTLMARRATLYKMLLKRNYGKVPCFVCGQHVELKDWSLEHVLEQRNGGTDQVKNLSISHRLCNTNRIKIEQQRSQK